MTLHKWLSKLIIPFALPALAVPMIAASCIAPEYEDEAFRTVPGETGALETGETGDPTFVDAGEESGETGDPTFVDTGEESGETGDPTFVDTGEESGETGDPTRVDTNGDDGDCQCESSSDTGDDAGTTGDDGESCVLTQGYWKTHNLEAQNPNLQEPWPLPEDTQLCDDSWIDILWTPPQGDAWYILAHQWIAAELNMAAGADASADVQNAAGHAELLLESCMISATDKPYATDLSELLDAYNNGNAGTVPCE